MIINANTKIAAILKGHPEALEAIISISPKFNKLRNPLLRKLMASRTSLAMASKVGGCTVEDFFKKLEPLGFVADKNIAIEKDKMPDTVPAFMSNVVEAHIVELDVRPIIEKGADPFSVIMQQVNLLQTGSVLKLINSFEPVPLVKILNKKGFESYVETVNENQVNTYFHKTREDANGITPEQKETGDWEILLKRFDGNQVTIDVRHLEMPQPMMTILEALGRLPEGHALFVYHKRIPVFLLPELKERKLDFRIKEIKEGEVHLLIFKP